jgi:Ser/Thr protein kinase RdoA (MazF antagonist)
LIPLESIPTFTRAEALAVAKREFGMAGAISTLPSERDQNFLIVDGRGEKFVLKIANAHDTPELLDFQNRAMRHVEESMPGCRVQRVVLSLSGSAVVRVRQSEAGRDHCVRLLTWIDGEVLAKSDARGPALFESVGAGLGKIDAALCSFTHPAMHRVLQWDLRRAGMAREHAWLLPTAKRAHVERLFSQWEEIDWTTLRHSVIHGDANDYNVIVGAGSMVGLLDFGDMVYSATVCELAIALAYMMLGEHAPLDVAAQVTRAYQRHYPLNQSERAALYPLVLSRLAMSVCHSAHNRARNPTDSYQVVSEAAAWDLLEKLDGPPRRDANGIWAAAAQ